MRAPLMVMLTMMVTMMTTATALAQSQAPELALPPSGIDVWGPLKPLPEPKPDVDWAKLTAGCTHRLQTLSDDKKEAIVTAEARLAYDQAGRLRKLEKLEGGKVEATTDFTYDGAGHLVKRVETHKEYTLTLDYTYTPAGLVEQVTRQESNYPAERMVWSYDAAGNPLRRATKGEKVDTAWSYERSKAGNLISVVTSTVDGKVNRVYDGVADAKGRLAKLTNGPQEDVITYDAAGREATRATTRDNQTSVATLHYDGGGRPTRIEVKGGNDETTRALGYDAKGHLTTSSYSRHLKSGQHQMTEVRDVTYVWEGDRLVAEKEKAGGGDGQHGFNLDGEASYRYDGKGRLVEMKAHVAGYPPLDRTTVTTYSY